MAELDPRRKSLWELQDFSQGRGLEIGPLHDAIVGKDQADVRYIDIQDQAGLRAYYQDHHGIPVENIPEIDYPLTRPDGRIVSLVEACRSGAPFDWVVASHVVEHVPDLIGWLGELAEVVADDGTLVLVVPDRRYCFDVHRPPTTVGEMLEAHLLGAVRPSVRAVYDHYSRVVHNDVVDLWQGNIPQYDARYHDREETLSLVEKSLETYVDSHVWLFTPADLVEQVHELRLIGRTQWYVDSIRPTNTNEIEFMVRLRRVSRDADADAATIDGELAPTGTRPDWLDDPARSGRVEELEELKAAVVHLQGKIDGRRGRTRRLRKKLAAQEALIERQRADLEQLRGTASVKAAQTAQRVVSLLRRRLPSGR